MESIILFEKIKNWIRKEKELGSQEAGSIVLATASSNGQVHSRVVALREITESGLLFFTQKGSRKVKDLSENPSASMTLWLALQRREVVLDGVVELLSHDENRLYWESLSRERQLRFCVYKSGERIETFNHLQLDYETLEKKYQDQNIPVSESYCGYRFIPSRIYFYCLGQDSFSQVTQYILNDGVWEEAIISP
ncbi:pyridoxamine 5'-phosphate oxidase family protein [Candidatus Berkiella cookevillensis]|uniref:Pyridoxamine 5'-phosphate oxidase family protein n=1 Tax=Candidatus Berkiella cookevillensis TaxID=437022 RepID=A0A0Q9YD97_9GAMM|nr:pyridoxamine 5'-phosphate oxidase family protein [Candidatus Berkiella cookevillensis]MCS5707913.1 pyridoxamine 5'-phosphate oxidase family protein [Candidatus Berkiella cookevillensis]